MTTGNSGDITANKIVTQLLNADEGIIKKLTSELVYSDYIKAKERYSIYNKNSEEYQDIIWYDESDYANSLKLGLMGKVIGTINPLNAYLEFKDQDDTIYIHGNLDTSSNKILCSELQVPNNTNLTGTISLEPSQGKITMNNVMVDAIKNCHSHNQIQTNTLALRINSTNISMYQDPDAGWQPLGINTYTNRTLAPSLGTNSNMYNSLYLAGGIQSLGTYNVTTSSGNSIYVTKEGYIRKYVASSSSMSLKNHIKEISYDDAKPLLDSRIFSFRYNSELYSLENQEESKKDRYGFILEDLERTFPMAVEHDEDGLPSSWCLQVVVPTHLAITKEHEHEIKQLKIENEQLRKELDLLKEEIHEISKN